MNHSLSLLKQKTGHHQPQLTDLHWVHQLPQRHNRKLPLPVLPAHPAILLLATGHPAKPSLKARLQFSLRDRHLLPQGPVSQSSITGLFFLAFIPRPSTQQGPQFPLGSIQHHPRPNTQVLVFIQCALAHSADIFVGLQHILGIAPHTVPECQSVPWVEKCTWNLRLQFAGTACRWQHYPTAGGSRDLDQLGPRAPHRSDQRAPPAVPSPLQLPEGFSCLPSPGLK